MTFSDADPIEFLRRLEIPDSDELGVGDSEAIAWQGGQPHRPPRIGGSVIKV
ncbi:hypothetical protein ACFYRL_30550 [Streptomyces goshikiensis]|uniref:hypothetical protein n=1 Tax=Streptomyces goshikiensis TaxID=1942 RepID=UPI0036B3D620